MFKVLLDLFFPELCAGCDTALRDGEAYICTPCRHALPLTQYHLNNSPQVEKIFYGRVPIAQATALLRFEKKGITQKLIHQLKYKNQEGIGVFLGDWLGGELKQLPNYQNIDLVLPVPLHKTKLKQRGYNQVTAFAKQLAEALNAKYTDDVLIKVSHTNSQVTKNRLARWTAKDSVFSIQNNSKIHGKHILLVDDIITTGATMEACANLLLPCKPSKLSLAAMAIA
ncbi:ComF family protein [Formosa sp. A9]|uniref:ComF family protein n=1 Tax=Formosa sp. A9 TaxID=3442641 RepID=UPI003EB86FB2